jgi:integrase
MIEHQPKKLKVDAASKPKGEAALLTAPTLDRYRPKAKRRRVRDLGSTGLFLVIEPSGHKSWQMRFRRPDGRPAKITLGKVDGSGAKAIKGDPQIGQPLTLLNARLLAAKLHQDRGLGKDVIGEHRAQKERQRAALERKDVNSFAAAVTDYIDAYAKKEQRGWRWTARVLGLDYPDDGGEPQVIKDGLVQRWSDKPVAGIDRALIKTVVSEARLTAIPGIKPRTKGRSEARARARQLFNILSSLFGWLTKDHIDVNPCVGMDRPDNAKARDRFLSDDELRWFWRAADSIDAPRAANAPRPFAPLLKLLLLTGCRVDEVAAMRREELSEDGATWNLPGSRTKNKKPFDVPLPPLARELIASMPERGAYVFSSNGRTPVSGFSRMKRRLDKLMLAIAKQEKPDAVIEGWRLHDVRRTFSTLLHEQVGIEPHIVEACLNHISGHKAGVAGTYNKAQYAPEKKAALERWARHVIGLVEGSGKDNVVDMAKPKPRKVR